MGCKEIKEGREVIASGWRRGWKPHTRPEEDFVAGLVSGAGDSAEKNAREQPEKEGMRRFRNIRCRRRGKSQQPKRKPSPVLRGSTEALWRADQPRGCLPMRGTVLTGPGIRNDYPFGHGTLTRQRNQPVLARQLPDGGASALLFHPFVTSPGASGRTQGNLPPHCPNFPLILIFQTNGK